MSSTVKDLLKNIPKSGGRKRRGGTRRRRGGRTRRGGSAQWGKALRKLSVPLVLLAANNLYRPGRVGKSVRGALRDVGVNGKRRRTRRRRSRRRSRRR